MQPSVTEIISLLLVPVTNIITYFATKARRNNDMLSELQKSVNMLVDENTKLYGIIAEQNKEICKLKVTINNLTSQLNGKNRLQTAR